MAERIQDSTVTEMKSVIRGLVPWSLDLSKIYNDLLFHGPDFHVIKSLEGVSEEGSVATLTGTRQMGWPGDLWKTDVAAIDGGLQLARLWGIHIIGKKSLPTSIGAYYSFHEGLVEGPINCELYGHNVRNERTISDISFYSEGGDLVAKMCDVEMHVLPDVLQ